MTRASATDRGLQCAKSASAGGSGLSLDALTDIELSALQERLSGLPEERPEWGAAATEFRQLRYFVTVAEELHFGRAATRLYLSQPALSQAIAKLESAIGVQLFVRNRQGVQLTAAGTELLARARAMLAARDDAVTQVRLIDQGEVGVLRLGVAMLAEHAVSEALSLLAARHPQVVVDRMVAVTDRLIESLTNGMLDAVLVHAMPSILDIEGVESELAITEPMAALMSPDHRLAGRSSLRIAELRDVPLLVPPRELAPSATVGMITMCRGFGGFEPRLFESAAMGTTPFGASWLEQAGGDVVALAGASLARAGLCPGLSAVPLESPPLLTIALVRRSGDKSPVVDHLVRLVRELREGADGR